MKKYLSLVTVLATLFAIAACSPTTVSVPVPAGVTMNGGTPVSGNLQVSVSLDNGTPAPAQETPAVQNTPAPATGKMTDCNGVIIATRNVVVNNETPCWLKINNGSATRVEFTTDTIATVWFGADTYLTLKHKGEFMDGVIAGTFRPVAAGWDFDAVRKDEIDYHGPSGPNPACLRDATQSDKALTTLCK